VLAWSHGTREARREVGQVRPGEPTNDNRTAGSAKSAVRSSVAECARWGGRHRPVPGRKPPSLTNGGAKKYGGRVEVKDVFLVGIDTLKVGYHLSGSLTEEDSQALKAAKAKSQERQFDSGGCPMAFHGYRFRLLPKGSRGYEWILQNDDVNIQLASEFNDGQSFPEAMVTYRSGYLWRDGWLAAEKHTRTWLKTFLNVVGEKVSRADLMVDVGASLPELDLTNGEIGGFCLRHDVHHIGGHAKGRSLTGYEFGAGDLMGRLYDKKKEAILKGKEWFFKLWKKNGWVGLGWVGMGSLRFAVWNLSGTGTNSKSGKSILSRTWRISCGTYGSIQRKHGCFSGRRWKAIATAEDGLLLICGYWFRRRGMSLAC
jgi:hypothetical protein